MGVVRPSAWHHQVYRKQSKQTRCSLTFQPQDPLVKENMLRDDHLEKTNFAQAQPRAVRPLTQRG
jgi:hypothetical protein